MKKCKCYYCQTIFDRDKEPWEQVTANRYAHKSCAEKYQVTVSTQDQQYNELVKYIESLFGTNYVNAKVAKQIRDFRQTYNYSYSGMLGTLVYWFEIKKGTIDKANGGIGIIPYMYEEAKKYFSTINAALAANQNIKNYKPKIIEITIAPPQPEEKRPRLFKLEEDEN